MDSEDNSSEGSATLKERKHNTLNKTKKKYSETCPTD